MPDGETLDRVEFYLNETKVATLFQPPFSQPIVLPKNEPLSYVRAVAYLPDGNSTEDLVFVNAPDYLEQLDVQFVELYASVLDRAGRPVSNLGKKDFSVLEDGKGQEIVRFDRVTDLPIHAAVAIDVFPEKALWRGVKLDPGEVWVANHIALFEKGIPLIQFVTNMSQLGGKRFVLVARLCLISR